MSWQIKTYEALAKPVFFKIDPETTHEMITLFGRFLGSNPLTKKITESFFHFKHESLKQTIAGISFENPVGLAAGFDKNAHLIHLLPAIGFGFAEIGSITAKPCRGNKKPRLHRLPEDNAIIVNYGLCNDGADIVAKRLAFYKHTMPLGISIAKTNDHSIQGDDSVSDYYESYKKLKRLGNYITINISCPNSGDGRSFEDPVLLEKLLKRVQKPQKPVFLKLSPDISRKNLDVVIALSKKYNITGFVVSNLTHDRTRLKTEKRHWSGKKGGISGLPVKNKSNDLIRYIYKKTNGRSILIGVGGIFTAEDAYEKIKNGASLVQLITGMIYRGPAVIRHINEGLVQLLKRDGFKNISEAVGHYVKE